MALRWTVFVEEQGVPEADELDGTDIGCTHILARHGANPVGAARYHFSDKVVKIGRVCVLQSARGSGIGEKLITYCCQKEGAMRARLGAQVTAQPFYEKLGFTPVGDIYDDAGIAHIDMEKTLNP